MTMTQSTLTESSVWLPRPRWNPRAGYPRRGSTDRQAWVMRLFCFPYSGAGASIYYPWIDQLPHIAEVCSVELPGRGNRLMEPPFTQMEPLVQAVAQALLPHLDRPFAFFGHSMGALVSFELARALRRSHALQPVCIFVSGHPAPHLRDRGLNVHTLPEPEFVAKLREMGGTPDEVLEHSELRELILPILRADFAVCETYTCEPDDPLDCPISAFGGLEDPEVSRDHLDAWRVHTRLSFQKRLFPGNHFFLHTAQSLVVHQVARDLAAVARI